MIAGSFTSFNGIAIGRIIRLNSNGSRDATFLILVWCCELYTQ
jgi:hypothetical protein